MCGCKKGVRNARTPGGRVISSPRNSFSVQGPVLTPKRINPNEQISAQAITPGMTADVRAVEKQRREAILRKLGRL